MGTKYLMPPRLTDSAGRPRRAGFEFELGNLPVIEAAYALQEALGGDLTLNNPFQALLSGTALQRTGRCW